jgi:methionine-rich copper-binding protein CopC
MTSSTAPRRVRTTLLAGLALAGSVALALAGPLAASAHNQLIDSTPEAGETLTALPDAFSITTNEDLLSLQGSQGFVLQVQDAAGLYYGDGCVQVSGPSMSAEPALGEPGAYTMLWQAVSEDGHSVNGEIPFTWAPAGNVEPSAGFTSPPVCGESSTPEPTATPLSFTPSPVAEAPTASGIDLATVLWIGGALLAIGIAVAIAIFVAGRKKA